MYINMQAIGDRFIVRIKDISEVAAAKRYVYLKKNDSDLGESIC